MAVSKQMATKEDVNAATSRIMRIFRLAESRQAAAKEKQRAVVKLRKGASAPSTSGLRGMDEGDRSENSERQEKAKWRRIADSLSKHHKTWDEEEL